MAMTSDPLVRRVFFGLALLFVIFIIYASWTPGSGGMTGDRTGFDRVAGAEELFRAHDVRDLATNVMLYMPLGFFLALATVGRRRRFMRPWLFAGLAVSLTMEIGQMFIGRSPDVVDLVTNSFGYVMGYWIVAASVQMYGLDPRVLIGIGTDDDQSGRTQTIAAARFIYISIYVLVALLPFDVSVSLGKIYAQLFANELGQVRLILDPAYHFSHWHESGVKLTIEFLGLVPIGVLTALLAGIKGRISLVGAVFATVVVAAGCEVCQLFILSRTTDIVVLPIAVASGIGGWALGYAWFKLQHTNTRSGPTQQRTWKPLVVAIIGYALLILFFAWSPFRFETDPVAVGKKVLYESNLIPFRQHFSTRSMGSAIDIVKEIGLFLPLGVLFAYLLFEILPGLARSRIIVLSGLACMAFAMFTELAQSVSIGRYIDITDVFLAGAGGLTGAVMLRVFRSEKPPEVHQSDGPQPGKKRRRKVKVKRYR